MAYQTGDMSNERMCGKILVAENVTYGISDLDPSMFESKMRELC